jgi:hypothetical protein
MIMRTPGKVDNHNVFTLIELPVSLKAADKARIGAAAAGADCARL